ncbi:MAG: response regulator [Bacteroidales bacterium]|nr:response regulator [Bacteroidales bacterium]
MKIAVVFLFLSFFGSVAVRAQSLQEPYGMDISNLHIQSIVQDSVGYIWMATARGLNRIDAYKKSSFYFHTSAITSLCDDNLYSLYVTREGSLVAFTRWGVNIYNRFSNNFIRLRGNNNLGFSCAEEGKDGKIWLGASSSAKIAYTNTTNNQIHTLYIPQLKGQISNMCCDDRGLLWLSSFNQGVFIFNPYTHKIVTCLKNLLRVFKSPYRNTLYGLTSDQKIVLVNSHSLKVEKSICNLSEEVVSINITADRRLYFLTHDMILSLYNLHTHSFDKRKIKGINSVYNITSLLVDRQSNVWVGTFEEGYLFIPVSKHTFDIDVALAEHFRNQFVTFLTSDSKDRFWIATRHNGLHEYNRKTDTDKIILNLHLTNEEAAIACCFHDSKGRLWVATVSALYCYDTKKGTSLLCKYSNIVKSRYITEDKQGNIWAICEANGGIWMLSASSHGKFVRPFASSIPNTANITYFRQLHSGRYLFSSYGDNVYLADLKGHIEPLFRHCNLQVASFLRSVIYIYEDSRHVLWLGTYGSGLMCYDARHNYTEVYTMSEGLPSNDILSIVEDPSHHVIWLSTSYGLSRLTGNSFMNYFTKNGLLGNQYHERAVYTNNGILYFTGNHGITSFSPQNISNVHYNVPFVIESLTTDAGIYYTAAISNKLKLGYRENSFTVSFLGFDYSSANSLQYSYILEGYDRHWSTPSTTHIVKFTDLPSGFYVLKVKVADNSGCWSNQIATLRIVVPPAPWKTWWAILIYIALISYMVYSGMRFYIRYRVDKEKIKLSEMTLNKERELNQAKINFFENVSHELRTPLGLIYGPFCELLKHGNFGNKGSEYMALMGANIERLMILVEQILSFSHLDSETLSLSVANSDIVTIVWKILKRFKGENEEKHIETSFSSTHEHLMMYVDEDKIDKIFTNLLSNAFKYTPSYGKIQVSLNVVSAQNVKETFNQVGVYDTDYVLFSVKDSGVGIASEEIDKIFDRFYRSKTKNNVSIVGSGIGLYYIKCLVKKHKGFIKAERNADRGTMFMFCLPLSDAVYQSSEMMGVCQVDSVDKKKIDLATIVLPQEEKIKEVQENKNNPLLLIVEDEPNLQEFLGDLLQSYYNVQKAFDGEEGLKKALETIPDIILMDVMMPLMDGYELCKKIKEDLHTCHIPVILLTAKSNVAEQIEGMNSGADVYIPKPFNPDYLKSVLQSVLRNRKRMQHMLVENQLHSKGIKEGTIHLNKLDRELLEKLDKKIDIELSNSDLSVDELAGELYFSRSTFYRKVKNLTGFSPNDYVRVYRVKKAAEFIQDGDYNLSEIADMTGFSTQSYFSSMFKKYYGLTPSEYKLNKQ